MVSTPFTAVLLVTVLAVWNLETIYYRPLTFHPTEQVPIHPAVYHGKPLELDGALQGRSARDLLPTLAPNNISNPTQFAFPDLYSNVPLSYKPTIMHSPLPFRMFEHEVEVRHQFRN
jgi:hypothetical protein